jgi:hypothetical protein
MNVGASVRTACKASAAAEAAALDAAGAGWGSAGLAAFALIVWTGPIGMSFGVTMSMASVGWAVVAILMWRLRKAF